MLTERETRTFDSRSKAIAGQNKLLDADSRSVLAALNDFVMVSRTSVERTLRLTNDLQKTQSEVLSKYHSSLVDDMKRIENGLQMIQSKEDLSERNLATITATVKDVQDTIANKLAAWTSDMQKTIMSLCNDIDETSIHSIAVVSTLGFLSAYNC